MMAYYFVKQSGLYGVKAGEVHRFSLAKGAPLLVSGAIEAYDKSNKRHREAVGAPDRDKVSAKGQ